MQSLLILGRQPEFGLAELESLYGEDKVKPIGSLAALVDVDPCLLAFNRLGGSIKFCKHLTEIDTTKWAEVESYIVNIAPTQSKKMPEGKMTLGLSLYGFEVTPKEILKTGLNIKRAIQTTGRSVRFVPNKHSELNSAQVIHNKLTSENGWELIFIKNGNKTIVAQTVKIQDIEAYASRDQNRPKRDAKVGMLPPKLAQIIINLAVGILPEEARQSICEIPPDQPIPLKALDKVILDPFCGSGVILQEALLMGYRVYGSDKEERLVQYSKENLEWLLSDHGQINASYKVNVADATTDTWQAFDYIASEAYLGLPYATAQDIEKLEQNIEYCNETLRKFLNNISKQLTSSSRLCIAVPAWRLKSGELKSLPLIDHLDDLGYNQVRFKAINESDLIYIRPDQFVARQLLTLTRK